MIRFWMRDRRGGDCVPSWRASMAGFVGWLVFALGLAATAAADDPPKPAAEASAEGAKSAYAAAAALQNRDEWSLAAEEWESLVKRFPEDPLAGKAWYYLGICLAKADRFADAARAFEKVASAKADPETRGLAAFERGRSLYSEARSGKKDAYAKAADALAAFRAKEPKHPKAADAWSLEAESLWQAGRKADAVDRWNGFIGEHGKAPTMSPRLPEVLYALGVGLAELGRKEESLAAFDRFAKEFPSHPLAADVTIWRADMLLQASRPADAEKLLDSPFPAGVETRPEVLERLARARYAQKRYGPAAESYAALATKFPESPAAKQAAMAAAIAFLEAKDTARAKEWFAKVESSGGPRAAEAAHQLALIELEAGRAADSLAIAERALARGPTGGQLSALLLDRADALWAMPERRADAAKQYAELVERFPNDPAVPTAMAMVAAAALQLDRPEEALARADAFLKRFAGKVPKETIADVRRIAAEALLASASRKAKGGDAAGAAAVYERLVKDFPEAERIELAWYRLGELREKAGRHDAAIEAFEKCLAAKPKPDRAARALLAIGWAHDAAGRGDAAAQAWGRVIETAPGSDLAGAALLARADLRQRKGDFKAAIGDARAAGATPLGADEKLDAMLIEALALVGDGRPVEAIPALVKIRSSMPRDFPAADRVLFELALAKLADDGSTTDSAARSDAEKDLRELVERFPKSEFAGEAWLELGELAWSREDWVRAGEAFARALDAKPSAPVAEQAAHRLGWSAVKRKDHAAAAAAFERQLAVAASGPLAADGWCMLGESRFRRDDFARAAEAFAKALADPAKLSSEEFRSLALVRASDCAARAMLFDESLRLARELLAKSPASPYALQARYAAGWALQNLGRLDEALAEYRGIAEGSRSELAARSRLMEGEVLFERGRHADAIKAFFKAAYGYGEKAAPPEYHPWQAQATFEAARCFEALGKTDQARKLYGELVERYPESQQVAAAKQRLEAIP